MKTTLTYPNGKVLLDVETEPDGARCATYTLELNARPVAVVQLLGGAIVGAMSTVSNDVEFHFRALCVRWEREALDTVSR